MEDVAAKQYARMLEHNGHKNKVVGECGLYVPPQHPFNGDSPDRIVSCCCGSGVLEIKCPLACLNTVPTVDNVDCLVQNESDVVLNPQHKCFDQIQGQMALVGCDWGDFYVYSSHGVFFTSALVIQKVTGI